MLQRRPKRICVECGAKASCLHKRRLKRLRYRAANPEKKAELDRNYYTRNAANIAIKNREKTWGITQDDYDSMLATQDGGCAICSVRDELLCVDHDHKTGKIRGLVCRRCNLALSVMDEVKGWEQIITVHLKRGV